MDSARPHRKLDAAPVAFAICVHGSLTKSACDSQTVRYPQSHFIHSIIYVAASIGFVSAAGREVGANIARLADVKSSLRTRPKSLGNHSANERRLQSLGWQLSPAAVDQAF